MRQMRAWMVGGAILSVAVLAMVAGTGRAGDDEKAQQAEVLKIAGALKGKKDQGQAMAAALAKKLGKDIGNLEGIMHAFKPRKKNGFGVGKAPGAIVPDGIELKINTLQRDGITGTAMGKEAEALEEMAYHTAAIAEITKNVDRVDFKGKKTQKDWVAFSEKMAEGSYKLAEAAKGKAAADVKTAAKMINDACNACHSVFRE